MLQNFFHPNQNSLSKPTEKQYKAMVRFLTAVVVVLAFVAGYYQTALSIERQRFARYEDMFVRVRSQLGREEMQRLIDQSYKEHPEAVIDW